MVVTIRTTVVVTICTTVVVAICIAVVAAICSSMVVTICIAVNHDSSYTFVACTIFTLKGFRIACWTTWCTPYSEGN